LQTGQRVGTAVGAAVLVATFHSATDAAGGRYDVGLAVTMGAAVLIVALALVLAVRELRSRRTCSLDENLSQRSVISRQ
jgi:hypothetical protein